MKKILLQYALLMLPVFAFAQNDAPLYKDFRIKTKGIEYCFKLNDHANAMQINLGDNNYELVAIDDKMQVAWSVMLKGLAYTGKFQEHILAIAASYKGGISTFTGLLIDEKTGKILLQKVIYEYKPETTEYPHTSFSNDGAFFTLILRHTVLSKSFSPFSSDEGETKSITSINFNGQLESKISKLKVPDGTYLNMTSNDQGDLYIFTYQKEKTITVYRYGAGKIEPSAPVILDIGLRHEDDVKHGRGEVTPSSADRNVVYFAAVHRNADNDNQLTVCKLDFKDNSTQFATEMLDRAHIKIIENNYVSFNKKLNKPSIGGGKTSFTSVIPNINVTYFQEYNGTLLVAWADSYLLKTEHGYYCEGNAPVINGYDLNLKPKFQQVMPVSYSYGLFLPACYYANNNTLYVVANTFFNPVAYSLFGQLDINSGKWLKLEPLPMDKKRVTNSQVLWNKDYFIVPYIKYVGFFPPLKETIDLQLNSY